MKQIAKHSSVGLGEWYLLAILLASAGTILAYKGPLSSNAWQCWSGPDAWKRDVARLLVVTALSAFMLWNMNAPGLGLWRQQNDNRFFFVRGHEWIILGVASLMLLLGSLVFLPNNFRHQLAFRAQSGFQDAPASCKQIAAVVAANEFAQIRKPYFPYLFYSLGLWLGIVFPVFLALLRRLGTDWQQWRKRRLQLDRFNLAGSLDAVDKPRFFDELLVAFQDYIVGLKEIAEHYVPLALTVSIGLFYDQLTPSHQTVTEAALEYSKIVIWLILGSVLPVCATIVAIGYQNAVYKVDLALHNLAEFLAKSCDNSKLFDEVVRTRSKLMWEQSPLTFVFSVIKSASVSLPLLLAVLIVIRSVRSVQGRDGWLELVLPKAFVAIAKAVFKP
jgi:hypothetical protein